MMLALTKPKFFIPVHGERRMLHKSGDMIVGMGHDRRNIIIGDNGRVIEMTAKSAKLGATVPSGRVLVDGMGVGDVGTVVLRGAHPNTALLRLEGVSGRKLEVMGASIGGGRINICQIDGITTNFGGDHNTLIVHNQDTPGHVAEVTTALAQRGINIATMQLYRSTAGGYAVMVLECDQPLPDALIAELRGMQGIVKVTGLNLAQQTETKEGA